MEIKPFQQFKTSARDWQEAAVLRGKGSYNLQHSPTYAVYLPSPVLRDVASSMELPILSTEKIPR
jgi:hypothetical protein